MKRVKIKRLNIRWYFIALTLATIVLITIATTLLSDLLHYFLKFPIHIPTSVYQIALSIILGALVSAFFSEKILSPITKLSMAMKKVADGDFTVKLDTDSIIGELQDVYQNFNIMTEELAATEIIQNDFISNVSHELKTPVNAIEGYATLLQGEASLSSNQYEYTEKILYNTRRLSSLVRNILLLSKIEHQVILDKEEFRLDEQIRQAIVVLEAKWSAKNIDLSANLENLVYTGNEGLLFQVWMNLIDNAIKFTPSDGEIVITLQSSESNILVSVKDSGCGISENDKKRIFEKFYQAETSHKNEGGGLGLALVHRIVMIHQGQVDVDNCPDHGCKFTVVLPIK